MLDLGSLLPPTHLLTMEMAPLQCCFAMEGYCCRAALSCIEWLSLVLHSLISLALLGLACACYFYGDAFSSVIDSAAGKVPCDTDAAREVFGKPVTAGTVCAALASSEHDLQPTKLGGCTSYCDAQRTADFVETNILRLAAAFSFAFCFSLARVVIICLLMRDSHRTALGHRPLPASESDHLNGVRLYSLAQGRLCVCLCVSVCECV